MAASAKFPFSKVLRLKSLNALYLGYFLYRLRNVQNSDVLFKISLINRPLAIARTLFQSKLEARKVWKVWYKKESLSGYIDWSFIKTAGET